MCEMLEARAVLILKTRKTYVAMGSVCNFLKLKTTVRQLLLHPVQLRSG